MNSENGLNAADLPSKTADSHPLSPGWRHALPFVVWIGIMMLPGEPAGWRYAIRAALGAGVFMGCRPWEYYKLPRWSDILVGGAGGDCRFAGLHWPGDSVGRAVSGDSGILPALVRAAGGASARYTGDIAVCSLGVRLPFEPGSAGGIRVCHCRRRRVFFGAVSSIAGWSTETFCP